MSEILKLKNVSKSYEGFKLDNINLTLDSGFIMGLIGPNGSGKSTTIKLILNLIKPDNGNIEVFGKKYPDNEKEIKNDIGFVLDQNHFYNHLTIHKMAKVIAPFYDRWSFESFYEYVDRFSLPVDKKIEVLSKGMKMKTSLAIALSHDAKLLLMDEPTSGLDPVVRDEFISILSELMLDERKSVIFSTHITSDLDKIADYIVFLKDGKVVLNQTKMDILENYSVVKGSKDILDQITPLLIGTRIHEYGFDALTSKKRELRNIEGIVLEKASLDDIVVYNTRR